MQMLKFLRGQPAAFDPDTLEILGVALDEAWRQVEADKTTYQIDGNAEGARDMLAQHIVNLARQGERDARRLVQGALCRLRL
jgi:hypothetical protein